MISFYKLHGFIKTYTMRVKLFVILLTVCIGLPFSGSAYAAGGQTPSESHINANGSGSFLENNSNSPAAEYLGSLSTKERGLTRSGDNWSNDLNGEITDWSVANNVGAPIDGRSLPIALSILVLYLIYRRVSTSRRKSDL